MSALALGIAGGVALVGTGLKAYEGFSQEHKANQLEKNLKDPIYNIPAEFYQNREIARQLSQQGLPQAVINAQTNRINQNQAAAIGAISRTGNPTGAASIVRQGDAAGNTLAAEDAQARQNNQRYFIEQNRQVAAQELAKQQNDVFDKYTRNYNEAAALKGAGMQNINSAVNDVTQLGEMGLSYGMSQNGSNTPDSSSFNNRANNPTLTANDTMTGYQLPGIPTQLPGNNLNFLPQPKVPYGTGWQPNNFAYPVFNNPYFPNT